MKRATMILLAATAVATTSLVAGVATASALTGPYQTPEAICNTGVIYAKPVVMSASVQSYSSGSTSTFGGTQWVGFRAHLARWTGSRWVDVLVGNWKAHEVALSGGDLAIDSYLDLTTGTSGSGTTAFRIPYSGYYYGVYFELQWFGNQFVAGGYIPAVAAAHYDVRTNVYDLGAHPYCKY